jgi:SagB-type dehydrogenase family enzyme
MEKKKDAWIEESVDFISATIFDKEDTHSVYSLSRTYHENTKLRKQHIRDDAGRIERIKKNVLLLNAVSKAFKTYSTVPTIPLTREFPPSIYSFDETLLRRRSVREYSDESLTLPEIAKILYFSYGVTGYLQSEAFHNIIQLVRAAPSGGALYPVEMYLASFNVEGLDPGIYHYNVKGHLLETLKRGDLKPEIIQASTYSEIVSPCSAIIFLTAIFDRNQIKYGERGYRFILLDTGHVAENIYLVATSLNLGAVCMAGFFDEEINGLLGLDGFNETFLYSCALGRPRWKP